MGKVRSPESPPIRGVNLGGWLVLERWMTKSLFNGTRARDEYSFMKTPGARQKLERHRRDFITEADFKWISQNGLNAVRIPVGYWLFEDDEPFMASYQYLDWAVVMAEKYNLKVLIDLHAAPGSQNGNDHSGRIGRAKWYKQSDMRDRTIEVLVQIAQRYYDSPAIWGIELLNEPKWGLFQFKLRRFYSQAYARLTQVARPGTRFIFSDAFTPRLMSGALKQKHPDFPVIMDVHWYQFTLNWQRPLEKYFNMVRRRAKFIQKLQRKQPVIVGEWSVVLSHESLVGRAPKVKNSLRQRHAKLQLQAYRPAAGWFYWNYKTEEPGSWNFRTLVDKGRIDPTSW